MQSSSPHSQRMLIVPVIVPKASLTPSIWSFTFRKRVSFRPIRSVRWSTRSMLPRSPPKEYLRLVETPAQEVAMAVKVLRCPYVWVKVGGHPCWRVQKALDEQGVEYEVVRLPFRKSKRDHVQQVSGQQSYPVIQFEDGSVYREASKGIEEEVERGVRIPLGRGFAGRVAAQVAPVVIEDVDRADIFNPILREKGIKSLLGAPLTVSGDVIGVVHVGTLTHRAFTPDDVDLLERVAERAALAIEHERLFEAEQAASERLHKLLLVTDAALSHLSLNALLDELLLRIRDILEADTAAFLMLDETRGDLVARAAKGIEEEVERGVRIPLGRGFAGRIAAERAPVVIEDVDHGEVLNPILREKGIKSLLGVPLLARGRVLGVVHVGMLRPRHFTPEDVELMQRAAERGALGVERALLYEELRHLDAVRHQFISIASHELR